MLRLSRGKIQELEIMPLDQSAPKIKSFEDSKKLASLYRQLIQGPDKISPNRMNLLRSITFWADFFPENEPFEGIVVNSLATMPIVPICEKRGELAFGEYKPTIDPLNLVSEEATVGDPISNCLGRCGKGCLQFEGQFSDLANNYTEDCFNHDLCVRSGSFFCGGEFTAAIDDYFNQIGCGPNIIGKWEVTGFLNENEIADVGGMTITFFDDGGPFSDGGTFSVAGGGTGTWEMVLNHFKFEFEGRIFRSYINATDLVLRGRVDNLDRDTVGYWTGVHITTNTGGP